MNLNGNLGTAKPCKTLENYEASTVVSYKSITLHSDIDSKSAPPLSSYIDELTRKIVESIDQFFPDLIVRGEEQAVNVQVDGNGNPIPKPKPEADPKPMALSVFDHRFWEEDFDEKLFEKAVKFLTDLKYVSKKTLINPFKELRQKILDEKKELFCQSEGVSPVEFWSLILDEMPNISSQLKDIILRGK